MLVGRQKDVCGACMRASELVPRQTHWISGGKQMDECRLHAERRHMQWAALSAVAASCRLQKEVAFTLGQHEYAADRFGQERVQTKERVLCGSGVLDAGVATIRTPAMPPACFQFTGKRRLDHYAG